MKLYVLAERFISDHVFHGVFTSLEMAEVVKDTPRNHHRRDDFEIVEIDSDAFIDDFGSVESIEEDRLGGAQ